MTGPIPSGHAGTVADAISINLSDTASMTSLEIIDNFIDGAAYMGCAGELAT